MLPEISARRSLLEPRFRYLSPGREGEKCRPLDHMWQIPFIHSVQFVITSNFHIYISKFADSFFQVVRIRTSWYGGYSTTAHVLFKNTEPEFENDYSRWQGGKNGYFAKSYIAKQNRQKWSILRLSIKIPKTYRNYLLKSLELFYAENCSKTHWLDVEKWQNWPFCKGHSKAKWWKNV